MLGMPCAAEVPEVPEVLHVSDMPGVPGVLATPCVADVPRCASRGRGPVRHSARRAGGRPGGHRAGGGHGSLADCHIPSAIPSASSVGGGSFGSCAGTVTSFPAPGRSANRATVRASRLS